MQKALMRAREDKSGLSGIFVSNHPDIILRSNVYSTLIINVLSYFAQRREKERPLEQEPLEIVDQN